MITRHEMIRYRRQMHRRIREVVAERRVARLDEGLNSTIDERSDADARSSHVEGSLVGG